MMGKLYCEKKFDTTLLILDYIFYKLDRFAPEYEKELTLIITAILLKTYLMNIMIKKMKFKQLNQNGMEL